MNRKFLKLIGVLSLSMLTYYFSPSPVFPQSYDPQDPEAVVRAYFQCLKEGDVQTLRTLIGGELLKERSRAMSDSRYSDFLREYFRDAVLQTIILKPIDQNTTSAELHISQGKNLSFVLLKLSRKNSSWLVTEELGR